MTKFAPATFDEVCGNEDVVFEIKQLLSRGNLPNVLLHGPEGTGKTTIARLITAGMPQSDCMYYDCVSDHSLRVMRDNIKQFAKICATSQFKVIIIDNADSLYPDAQAFMRRIMETYLTTTRFIFIMRDMHKLTEPIQSRCIIFYIAAPSILRLARFLQERIGVRERPTALAIAQQSRGSFRRAIMMAEGAELCGIDNVPGEFYADLGAAAGSAVGVAAVLQKYIFKAGESPAQFFENVLLGRGGDWSLGVYETVGGAVNDIRAGRHIMACSLRAGLALAEGLAQ